MFINFTLLHYSNKMVTVQNVIDRVIHKLFTSKVMNVINNEKLISFNAKVIVCCNRKTCVYDKVCVCVCQTARVCVCVCIRVKVCLFQLMCVCACVCDEV